MWRRRVETFEKKSSSAIPLAVHSSSRECEGTKGTMVDDLKQIILEHLPQPQQFSRDSLNDFSPKFALLIEVLMIYMAQGDSFRGVVFGVC